MSKKIFISYARDDSKIVEEYLSNIRMMGYEVLIDKDAMHAGDVLTDKIKQLINDSFCTIFFLSDKSITSKWCLLEMSYLHNTYETNFDNINREKSLRGCIVVQLQKGDFAYYNKNSDAFSGEKQNYIRDFYKLFNTEQIRIIHTPNSDEHIKQLASSIESILVRKNQADLESQQEISNYENRQNQPVLDLERYDTQDMLSSTDNEGDNPEITGGTFYKIGELFLKEDSLFKNIEEAIKMFNYAAVLGEIRAVVKLGDIYMYGTFGFTDYSNAFKYYNEAADRGNVEGYHKLGLCYEKGLGVEQDYVKAFEYYKKAADMNYAKSQCNLGLMYLKGQGVECDDVKSFEYIKKSADQNYGRGYYCLGLAYHRGIGVRLNKDLAEECFKNAIDLGYVPAMSKLASLYRRQKKYIEEIQLLEKSADLNWMKSCIKLGDIYYYGSDGVEQNFQKAFEYYKKASKSDYLFVLDDSNKTANCENSNANNQVEESKEGSSYAYFRLGNMYARGEGVESDAKMAIENWMQAVERGNTEAIFTIAEYYYSIENYLVAFEWYKKALNNSESRAFFSLLNMYRQGQLEADKMLEIFQIIEDYSKDFPVWNVVRTTKEMFRKIGRIYDSGYIVEKNCKKAMQIYQCYAKDALWNSLIVDTNESYCEAVQNAQKYIRPYFNKLPYIKAFNGIDCKKNYSESFKMCQEYVEENPLKECKLGKYYYFGLGTEKDVNKAFEIWQNYSNDSESIYFLGKLYEDGVIVEKNIDKALSLYEEAKADELLARIELFEIYSEGRYGIKNPARALAYLEDGLQTYFYKDTNDTGKADYLLGFVYSNGLGTEVDVFEAVYHYIISASKGYALANLELGKYCISKGYKYEAIKHLVTATESGIDGAKELLSTLIL